MSTRVLVTQFGALANGRTDDADVIARAARVATERGATLVFPPGTYALGSAVTLGPLRSVDGEGATLRALAGYGGTGVVLSAPEDLELRGLTLEGFTLGLQLVGSRDTRLSRLTLRDCGLGLEIVGGEDIELSHSRFTGNNVDLSLRTGAEGLSLLHLHHNRMDSATPLHFVRDGVEATLRRLLVGPGDTIAGTLSLPSWAEHTTLLHLRIGGLLDEGFSTTALGVSGVEACVHGRRHAPVGTNVPVPAGLKLAWVGFLTAEPDDAYVPSIAPSWNSTWSITTKRTDGFEVRFGTMAPTNARFDWLIRR